MAYDDTAKTKAVQARPKPNPAEVRDEVIKTLRDIFPHGHPGFLPTSVKELQLHSDKNHDYSKGGAPLGNFDRVAAILSLYPNLKLGDRRVVALVYALKQLDAVLWGINSGIQHKVEGLNDRLQDISVYSKIVMCMNEDDTLNRDTDRQFGCDLQYRTSPGWGVREDL